MVVVMEAMNQKQKEIDLLINEAGVHVAKALDLLMQLDAIIHPELTQGGKGGSCISPTNGSILGEG